MIRKHFRRLRAMANEPSQTKRGWVWATNTAILALIVVVAGGSARYVQDQRAEDHERFTEIEMLRCDQRIESQERLRGVFIGLAGVLGADEETVVLVTTFLDEQYAPDTLEECLNPTPPPEASR